MDNFTIGSVFTIAYSPFRAGIEVLIGADASFIPPIFVAAEVRNSNNNFDPDTGNQALQQVKGIFYSHKNHKYQTRWFSASEVRLLAEPDDSVADIEHSNKRIDLLKKDLKNKWVILKSVDMELAKKKISTGIKNLGATTFKSSPYLNFVPPPMHIIDVRSATEMKNNYYKNSGKEKVSFSRIEVKCKWYNPDGASFSEEWLPYNCLKSMPVNYNISEIHDCIGKYYLRRYLKPISLDDVRLTYSLIRIEKVVYNHYKYDLIIKDKFSNEMSSIGIDQIDFSNEFSIPSIESLYEEQIPDIEQNKYSISPECFEEKKFYEITYLSHRNQITTRYIFIIKKITFGDEDERDALLVAYCLLRHGAIRHFRVSSVKSVKKIKQSFIEKISNDNLH